MSLHEHPERKALTEALLALYEKKGVNENGTTEVTNKELQEASGLKYWDAHCGMFELKKAGLIEYETPYKSGKGFYAYIYKLNPVLIDALKGE